MLLFHDLKASASLGAEARNDPEAARLYVDYYCRVDPRASSPSVGRLVVPGNAVSDEMLVSYTDVQRSEYHCDFILGSKWSA